MKNGYLYIMSYVYNNQRYHKIGKSLKEPKDRALQIEKNTNYTVKVNVLMSWKVQYYTAVEKAIQYMFYKNKIKIIDGNPDGWTELYEIKEDTLDKLTELLPQSSNGYECILKNEFRTSALSQIEDIKQNLLDNNTFSEKIFDKEKFKIIKRKILEQIGI